MSNPFERLLNRLSGTTGRQLLTYSLVLAILSLLLRYFEYRFIFFSPRFEIYAGLIALMFTLLGIWLATRLMRPEKEVVVIEKEVRLEPGAEFLRDEALAEKLGLSRRELEVLEQMALGLSNQEVADRLFVSVNTVKTHTSNILEKLDVKRRTQAVAKAKSLRLIP